MKSKAKKGTAFSIFIVDPSEMFLDVLSLYLGGIPRLLPGNLKTFISGEACIAAIDPVKPPDIVLTEYMLADKAGSIDGLELLKQLKNIDHKIKVIAVSAQGDFWVCTQFYLWGAADYISKGSGIKQKLRLSVIKILNEKDAGKQVINLPVAKTNK